MDDEVVMRKFPYPYKAALTICSDIDQTFSVEEFLKIQRFLNSKDSTSMGPGIGLEIGNSFFMFEPNRHFSYFSNKKKDQEVIREYIKNGLIDCMHSYGEKHDFSREDAKRSIMELNKLNSNIDVWIDHSYEVDNLGNDITGGMGDVKGSIVYHSDLIVEYGFKFFWLGRLSSVIVQERPIKLDMFISIFDSDHILNSSINMVKEFAKHILAVFGYKKYAMHKDYRVVKVKSLRDGQRVFEFIRCSGHWRGVGEGADSKGLAYMLSKGNLKSLIKNHGYTIIYTHLGKNSDCKDVIAKETQEALWNLSSEYKSGNIYVTTTSKLLNYNIRRKYLKWEKEVSSDFTYIKISGVHDPLSCRDFMPDSKQLQGITFYVPEPGKTRVFLGTEEIRNMQINPPDCIGRKSIMFPLN